MCMHLFIYIYTSVYIYINIHICIHVYIHMHTNRIPRDATLRRRPNHHGRCAPSTTSAFGKCGTTHLGRGSETHGRVTGGNTTSSMRERPMERDQSKGSTASRINPEVREGQDGQEEHMRVEDKKKVKKGVINKGKEVTKPKTTKGTGSKKGTGSGSSVPSKHGHLLPYLKQ